MLVGVLVVNYHQQVDQAWRCTLREFFVIADYKGEARRRHRVEWDDEKMGDMMQHLRGLGIQGV